jgi:hypothetical protein
MSTATVEVLSHGLQPSTILLLSIVRPSYLLNMPMSVVRMPLSCPDLSSVLLLSWKNVIRYPGSAADPTVGLHQDEHAACHRYHIEKLPRRRLRYGFPLVFCVRNCPDATDRLFPCMSPAVSSGVCYVDWKEGHSRAQRVLGRVFGYCKASFVRRSRRPPAAVRPEDIFCRSTRSEELYHFRQTVRPLVLMVFLGRSTWSRARGSELLRRGIANPIAGGCIIGIAASVRSLPVYLRPSAHNSGVVVFCAGYMRESDLAWCAWLSDSRDIGMR